MFARAQSSIMLSLVRHFKVMYNINHQWVRFDEKTSIAVFGITEFSQSQLGGILHLYLPKVNTKYRNGEVLATIESQKVTEEVFAPLTGTVIEVNNLLLTHPEVINQSAESNGWIAKIKADDPKEIDRMLDEESYKKLATKLKSGVFN